MRSGVAKGKGTKKKSTAKMEESKVELMEGATLSGVVPASDDLVNELAAMADLYNKKHKTTPIKPASNFARPEVIPTGIPELDHNVLAIGGFPRGRVVEIGGEPSAGKTTLALNFCKQAIDRGLKVIYCENENTLDYEYGEKIGLHKDSYMIFKGEGLSGEEFLENVIEFIEMGFDIVVVDALNGVKSDKFIETDLKNVNMNTDFSQAKLVTEFKDKLQGGWISKLAEKTDKQKEAEEKKGGKNKRRKGKIVKLSDCTTTVLLLTHLKLKTDGSGIKDTNGSEAIKLLYSIRLFIERLSVGKEPEKDEYGDIIYSRIKARTFKNKLAPPYKQCYLYLDNRTGQFVSDKKVIVDLAERKGCIIKKGGWVFQQEGFPWADAGLSEKWHGASKFLEYLETDEKMKLFILGNAKDINE